ncbi:hypothetical protein BFJ63_vAg17221 [Fusarium oxysporum f. sp. narcissi]|uniref:Uncharacterized protein n=3 Tax=Fusarium oxysporum TaxID=5507 RepID=A0A4V1RY02_FUSOX|nr:hypothetical protein H9L39_07910 [Fusarium oxysporum f. sp. albedinis]RKK10586.1 hypothetical protein BFJ65_g14582 [Fusarium oxysporum f. sp. cepae]RKK26847.1 hypothetical protein BFJ66_g16934 [Fusarium oxysporum f. sp. cepae]RYC79896.1 hypothetical protein BFJ63_vAg17221 [Fusarium oxysporum f. sp. narcissi]
MLLFYSTPTSNRTPCRTRAVSETNYVTTPQAVGSQAVESSADGVGSMPNLAAGSNSGSGSGNQGRDEDNHSFSCNACGIRRRDVNQTPTTAYILLIPADICLTAMNRRPFRVCEYSILINALLPMEESGATAENVIRSTTKIERHHLDTIHLI